MRLSGAVVSGLLRFSSRPPAARLLCCTDRRAAPQHRRCVHLSPVFSAKTLLHKFSTKSKKKPWYDSPSFFRPDDKPQGLMSLMKTEQKVKRGNNARLKILNSILFKAVTGLLSTAEVSEEVFDLQIVLSKVSTTVDFSVCRVYWLSSSNKETDAKIETILQKFAPRFRHLLITHQVLGNVPTIVFLKDQEDAKRQEIEDLLATLEFEDDNGPTVKSDDTPRNLDSTSLSLFSTPSMFGIDHIELNKKITEYKKGMKEKEPENEATEFSQQQQEQLAEIKKQKLLKKKLKKKKWAEWNHVEPQNYLFASDNDLYSDIQEEYDTELEEDIEEKDGGSKLN